jgi:hypothetical protein
MKRLLFLALWASPLMAQQALQVKVLDPVGIGAYPNPLAVYSVPLAATGPNNTLIAIVQTVNNPVVSEPGNTWTNPCPGLWTAPTLGTAETPIITYSSVQYTGAVFAEFPGQLVIDSCSPLATGNGAAAASASISTTVANELVIGYGWQGTTNYDTVTPGAGFGLELFKGQTVESTLLEDMVQATPGSVSGLATWSTPVGWTQAVATFKPLTPPPPPLTLNLATKIVFCVKCDRTDDSPAQGALFFQQGTANSSFSFAADGSVTVNLSISMASDPVIFSVFLQNVNGQEATGAGWTWSIPRASLSAGVATLGTLSFGGIAFTLNSDGSVSFAGFLPAS